MQVQATSAGNQQVAPKEFSKLPEQQGDAGAFDAAVNALLSVINNNRQQTFQQTFDTVGNRNMNGRDNAPVADKTFVQVGHAEELSRKVMRMAADAAMRESAFRDTGGGIAASDDDDEMENIKSVSANNNGNSIGGANDETDNRPGLVAAEVVVAEEPAGLAAVVAANEDSPKAVPPAEEQPRLVQIRQEQPRQEQPHDQQNHQVSRRLDILMGHLLMKNDKAEIAAEIPAQAIMADNEMAEVVKADDAMNKVRLVIEPEQTAKNQQTDNLAPEPAKTANAGNVLNQEKVATVHNAENSQGKPAPESAVKVVIAETHDQQQQQPQQEQQADTRRGNRETLIFQYKQAEPVTVDTGKSSPVMAEKVDPASVLNTANAVQAGAQQAAAAANEPVTLDGLRDRMVQEVRYLFQSLGNSKQQAQVHLKLHPANLGELTVRLFFQKGGEITAHFYAASNNVKEVLESSMQQLKSALQQQDLKLNDTQVFLGEYNRDQQENPGFNAEGRGHKITERYSANSDGEEAEAVESSPMREAEDSEYQVNYYV